MPRVRPAEITDELNDLWRLIVGYTKQETAAPLRGLAAFIRYGLLGMVMFAIGAAFAALAIVRALQTEVDAFDGGIGAVAPYVASVVGCTIVLGLAVRSVARTPWKSKDEGNPK